MRLIDADALSDWMKDYGQKCINGERKISLMYVWKHIQDMQTIEERKTGRWIYEEDGIIHGHCSCCGFHAIYQETDVFGYDFCPNCGADLRGNINVNE